MIAAAGVLEEPPSCASHYTLLSPEQAALDQFLALLWQLTNAENGMLGRCVEHLLF